MNSSIKNIIIFSIGAFTGGATAYYFIRKAYEQIANEEIESVKNSFRHAAQAMSEYKGRDETEATGEKLHREKGSASDAVRYGTFFGNETANTYPDYNGAENVCFNKAELADMQMTSERNNSERPYVLAPDYLGEYEDYLVITLIYYADGILADEDGNVIDNADEVVGRDSLSHFGEYENDAVFVRNDVLKCDYEILRDERSYSDIEKTMPKKL